MPNILERIITIQNVQTKETGWTEVLDEQNVKYSTKDPAIRELADGSKGAKAKILFTETQKGQWTNRYIAGLDVVNGPVSPSNGSVDVNQLQVPLPEQNGSDDRQIKIMRQSAAKIAAHIESAHPDPQGFDPDNFFEFCEVLIQYFENGLPTYDIPFGAEA